MSGTREICSPTLLLWLVAGLGALASCGDPKSIDFECGVTGQCDPCVPQCDERACGADGCGGLCGSCDSGQTCSRGLCEAEPVLGTMCDRCESSRDCEAGLTCATWRFVPEVSLCTRPCVDDINCAGEIDASCNSSYVCAPRVIALCDGNTAALRDACGNVLHTEPCSERQQCVEGLCRGTGISCDACDGSSDCADGYRCRHWRSFPEITWCALPCTDDQDCAADGDHGMTCSSNGFCRPEVFDPLCHDDGIETRDSCSHVLSTEPCPEGQVCIPGRDGPECVAPDGV